MKLGRTGKNQKVDSYNLKISDKRFLKEEPVGACRIDEQLKRDKISAFCTL